MGSERKVVDLREMRDFPAFRKSSALGNVRHNHVGALPLEEFTKPPTQIKIFTDADWRLAARTYLLQRFDILRRDRLFQPEQAEALHLAGDAAGTWHVVSRMKVDA